MSIQIGGLGKHLASLASLVDLDSSFDEVLMVEALLLSAQKFRLALVARSFDYLLLLVLSSCIYDFISSFYNLSFYPSILYFFTSCLLYK